MTHVEQLQTVDQVEKSSFPRCEQEKKILSLLTLTRYNSSNAIYEVKHDKLQMVLVRETTWGPESC